MELKLGKVERRLSADYKLLIVPYGIETCGVAMYSLALSLLIVPYGIETLQEDGNDFIAGPFNRTLWN